MQSETAKAKETTIPISNKLVTNIIITTNNNESPAEFRRTSKNNSITKIAVQNEVASGTPNNNISVEQLKLAELGNGKTGAIQKRFAKHKSRILNAAILGHLSKHNTGVNVPSKCLVYRVLQMLGSKTSREIKVAMKSNKRKTISRIFISKLFLRQNKHS